MKRFYFRQEKLLSIKRQLRRQAELGMQKIQTELLENAGQLDQLREQMSGSADVTNFRGDAWSWIQMTKHSQARFDSLRQRMQALEEDLDAARNEYLALDRDVQSLERLREMRIREYQLRVSREEQQTLDEVALQRWRPLTSHKGDTP